MRTLIKRVVKMPKLYFYDTGLAIALLGFENERIWKRTHSG
jgi:predicted AAA+ superfamily ATPase